MKQLQLPKMSTDKPAVRSNSSDTEACCNHLQKKFNQKAPNPVWVSDITYIKAGGIWYYLCIVMDLFSRKVISWHISSKANVELVITAFKKAYEKRNAPYGLMFHSDRGSSILPSPLGGFSTLLMLCSLFLRKVILLTMLAVNVFSSISKKKKQIANVIVRLRSFSYLFLNILKGITTQKDRTERLICLRQMKQKLYIGSRQNSLLPLKKLYFFCVYLLDYSSKITSRTETVANGDTNEKVVYITITAKTTLALPDRGKNAHTRQSRVIFLGAVPLFSMKTSLLS